jgi:predicted alpha/beta hydrolase
MELLPLSACDGSTLEARWFAPAQPQAGLLWIPAMGVAARSYDRFAEQVAARGVAMLVAENRGGESSSLRARRGVDFGYSEMLEDFARLEDTLRSRLNGQPVHLGGHSLGGQLSLLLMGRLQPSARKLVLVASGTVHFSCYGFPHNLRVLFGTQLAAAIASTLGYFPGHRLGFGGLQPKSVISDWARVARSGKYLASNGTDLEAGLAQLGSEVLAVHLADDTFSPRAATDALLAKLPCARVTHAEVSAPSGAGKLDSHFRWMRGPEPVVDAVARFIAAA